MRGLAHARAERYALAVTEYDASIKLRSTWDTAFVNRAVAKMELQQYAAAETDLTQAYKLNAKNARILAVRGQLNARQGKMANAESDFRDALAIDPQNVTARIGQQALIAVHAVEQLPRKAGR